MKLGEFKTTKTLWEGCRNSSSLWLFWKTTLKKCDSNSKIWKKNFLWIEEGCVQIWTLSFFKKFFVSRNKNDLEISENWQFVPENIRNSKIRKKIFPQQEVCPSLNTITFFDWVKASRNKNHLEIFENWPFDLEKTRNSEVWKTFFYP